MRRPVALYDIRHLLQEQLPHLPGCLRAVLALWVEGTLLGLNGCQDTVTLALAQGLRGPRNLHTLRRRQRELLYDDADRIDSWGPGQELEVERCFAPLLQWVRRQGGPGLTTSAGCCACWPQPCRLRCRCLCSVTRGWAVGTCGRRLWLWAGTPACATRPASPFSRRARPNVYRCAH